MADIKLYGAVINAEGNPAIDSASIKAAQPQVTGITPDNGSWYTLSEAISYIYANIGAINDDLKNINTVLNKKTLITLN